MGLVRTGSATGHTSMAIWLTTAVWFGNLMSLVWWWSGDPRLLGVVESRSTMKAPWTLILTLPGCMIVLSISAVFVAVLGLSICSAAVTRSCAATSSPTTSCAACSSVGFSMLSCGSRLRE